MKCAPLWFLATVLLGTASCKESSTSATGVSPPDEHSGHNRTGVSPGSSSKAASTAPSTNVEPRSASAPGVYRIPVGPPLAILPGEGVGPIRFGATLKTIERLMEGPCTEKIERGSILYCRYQAHAVDFKLQDGVLNEIRVHGPEREFHAGKGLEVENVYGIFNGGFANGFRLGMYPKFANLGEPLRKETVTPGRFPTVEKHYYEGIVLELDKLRNGNIVFGGAVITKNDKAPSVVPGQDKQ